jgi:hypothetical protein
MAVMSCVCGLMASMCRSTERPKANIKNQVDKEKARSGGEIGNRSNLTFGQFVTEWLEDDVRPNHKPSTICAYESIVKNHLLPRFVKKNKKKLQKLDSEDIRSFTETCEIAVSVTRCSRRFTIFCTPF